ncbi:MAG: hypothetical protein IJW29_06345 [Clostridia bacterium]|nr:hypothetical protein [Clostridia bacterium]
MHRNEQPTVKPPEPVTVKKCSKCGEELPADNFAFSNRTKDGLHTQCKECSNAYKNAYRAKRRGE